MTTLPLQFQFDNVKGLMFVLGEPQPITAAALASNINFVQWDAVTAIGKIIYNDRLPLPEQFTDPSPYQTQVNQWMTSAAALATNPLSLAQAQAVKSSLIDSIWLGKRTANVTVSTSLGSYTFNPTDLFSSDVMNWLPALAAIVAQVNATNSDIATMVGTINTAISTVCGEANTAANTVTSELNSNFAAYYAFYSTHVFPYGEGNGSSPNLPNWGISNTSPASYSGPSVLASLTAPIKMLPVGSTSYPAFTLADLFAVLAAVQTQRANEAVVRASKQAAVAALSTVASCISYDATTGW
jgi:hypothetical protein